MKYFTFDQLTAGIKDRHVGAERARLIEKWSRTGLLRGLDGYRRESMSQLLENQAAQLLRESNSLSTGGGAVTSSGQIQGISAVAFPIIRRVFGGLVSNELVSIQPMSLPNGLIFYIDYTYGSNVGGDAAMTGGASATYETYKKGQSIYANPTGRGIQSGSLGVGGMYDNVGTGYSKVHSGSATVSGSNALIGAWTGASEAWTVGGTIASINDMTGTNARMLNYDPQVESDVSLNNIDVCFVHVLTSAITSKIPYADLLAVDQIGVFGFTAGGVEWGEAYQGGGGVLNLRRLNKRGNFSSSGVFTPDAMNGTHIQFVIRLANAGSVPTINTAVLKMSTVVSSQLSVDSTTGATLVIPSFESDFGTTPAPSIPEIDIKIESISITATTKRLRARWSPELAQDLNAYHSLDAEVELTSILSEQIALEIDRDILNDLLMNANGANFYWSRAPGKFVNKTTGAEIFLTNSLSAGPHFTGTVTDWYQTLTETIVDVANTIHRKTLRGSANFIVTGPDVCTMLECSVAYKAKYSIDGDGQASSPFSIGAEAVGSLSNRFTVYKDPHFPRSRILVGYKGGSYLETGYVYAPYVPLIVTPTIFAPEDMTPRKGVMTRFGKKIVRSDYYGTVTVLDMNTI